YGGFLAGNEAPQFEAGLLPVQSVSVNPAMRELVRRGAAALPALISHLGDKRPTRLKKGLQYDMGFGGQIYADEYDPRVGIPCGPPDCTGEDVGRWFVEMPCTDTCHPFHGKYAVKVGDVCEVAIGQIVNRSLSAVRYQPTNILYVNSPIESPSLIARIKKDWGGVDAAGLEAALLDDLRIHVGRSDGALMRLRFYYPKTYAALSGKDLEKRNAFEADEKTRR
ncbi:MAG TPA: hypothetical protein VFV07_08730, partial [Rhizomicrobium sp.]|nr:hypothetical protein [Rhizomicrobium sp.]